MAGNVENNPTYLAEVLGKIYASFIINGQGSVSNYNPDITASDDDFFTSNRALWNLQELSTDEAICAWSDVGISDINTQTWSPTNTFLTALYQRLGLSITYANDFIRMTNGSSDTTILRYNAEARFLRALAYYYFMDLFGNPPFTTDADGVGKFFPKQISRANLFNYVVSELHAIENKLGAPGFSYPEADQAACWMLLARTYLNAQVFTGTAKWDSCLIYCNKVANCGKYSLASNYRHNFAADNDGPENPEMIFAWEQNGIYTACYVGTTFIIESCCDGTYLKANDYGLYSNTNWNGNRTKRQFVNVLVDTLATYGNVPIPSTDPWFSQCKDGRVFLRQKLSLDIPSASASGNYGIGVYKFTARNTDGTLPTVDTSATYASTDFPVFRYADALLMRAESNLNLGNTADAVTDINAVRERAFGGAAGDITAATLASNPSFILDERGREFYYESQRRTDLIRFGKFTTGGYNWAWKGDVYAGTSTDAHLNIYPIPGDEVSANPNIKQNPGY
jgi:hypothetical protein